MTRAFELAGARWNLAIVRELQSGTTRFNALRDSLGISAPMLTRRLHMLSAYGVVDRRPLSSQPSCFEYVLTPSGRELSTVVAGLTAWGERHLAHDSQEGAAGLSLVVGAGS